MNNNVKIARQLLKIARTLVASNEDKWDVYEDTSWMDDDYAYINCADGHIGTFNTEKGLSKEELEKKFLETIELFTADEDGTVNFDSKNVSFKWTRDDSICEMLERGSMIYYFKRVL